MYIFYLLIDINGVKISGNIWITERDYAIRCNFELMKIVSKSIEFRFIYTFLSSLLLLCFRFQWAFNANHRATISFFFFFFFLNEISIKTRLHYLIWWRGKLSQDKLPIRSRLARCYSPLGRHFWSTPSRYRCFCTLLCKMSEREFSYEKNLGIKNSSRFFHLTIENRIRNAIGFGHFVRNIGLNWRAYLVAIARFDYFDKHALSLNFNRCTYVLFNVFREQTKSFHLFVHYVIYVWSTIDFCSLFDSIVRPFARTFELANFVHRIFFLHRRKR